MIVDKRTLKGKRKSNHIVVRIGKSFGAIRIKIPRGINTNHLKLIWREEGYIDGDLPKKLCNQSNKFSSPNLTFKICLIS